MLSDVLSQKRVASIARISLITKLDPHFVAILTLANLRPVRDGLASENAFGSKEKKGIIT